MAPEEKVLIPQDQFDIIQATRPDDAETFKAITEEAPEELQENDSVDELETEETQDGAEEVLTEEIIEEEPEEEDPEEEPEAPSSEIESFEDTERKKEGEAYLYKLKVYGEDKWVPWSVYQQHAQVGEAQGQRWSEISEKERELEAKIKEYEETREVFSMFGATPKPEPLKDEFGLYDETEDKPANMSPQEAARLKKAEDALAQIEQDKRRTSGLDSAFATVGKMINDIGGYIPSDSNRVINQIAMDTGGMNDDFWNKASDVNYVYDAYRKVHAADIESHISVPKKTSPDNSNSPLKPPKSTTPTTKRKTALVSDLQKLQKERDEIKVKLNSASNLRSESTVDLAVRLQEINEKISKGS